MRLRQAALVALLVVLAGCSAGFTGTAPEAGTNTDAATPSATPTPTATATATDGSSDDGTETPTATPVPTTPPDPETDVLGWENGYWANETLTLDRSDGLNESEIDAVVSRAMARVEVVRGLEFGDDVPVNLISREEFRDSPASGSPNYSEPFRTFDNAKFEAMFLVGEDEDSLAVQQSNRGSSVAGYYSPANDQIVVIYPGDTADLPGEGTLSHELTHAIQDQQFGLGDVTATTRDESNAQSGLIEGEANLVQDRYMANCGEEWACLAPPESDGGGGGGGDLHLGIYILNFFPYSDGPGFVRYYENRGGWDRVGEMYDDLPASSEQVIEPETYAVNPDRPTDVSLRDSQSNGWERVRPDRRANYAELGQSAMTAMFAYTLYDDYRQGGVIQPDEFLNTEDGQVNRTDPFEYDIAYTDGWDGDRMHVYEKGDETAYVWKTVWDSPAEAEEFAEGYRELLSHWGAEGTGGDVYRVDDGPYEDSFRLVVEGDTVTIVNAPEESDLGDVYAD
jgi:hypothetical protein